MAWENLYTRVDSELKEALDQFCAEKNVSIREVVETSLKNYLRAEKGGDKGCQKYKTKPA